MTAVRCGFSTSASADCYVQRMRRRRRAVLVLMGAFVLTSCTTQQPSYPEFARDQTDADRPSAIVDGTDSLIDVASLRHVGDVDGYEVYLARGRDAPDTICIAIVKDDVWESTGCGGDRITLTTRSGIEIEASSFQPQDDRNDALSESVRIVR